MTLDTSRLRDLATSDAGFVFDPVTGRTFTVNGTGLALLRALKEGQGLEVAVADLVSAFELATLEEASRDADEFVSRLREYGLVR